MSPPETLDLILAQIFDPTVLPDERPNNNLLIPPSFEEIKEVAQLILEDQGEEAFQKFFAKRPQFIFRATPSSGDHILGFLVKPNIGDFYTADYAIVTVGQGGCGITLIELESPSDKLFTNKMTPAKKLQTALGQIDDWNEWMVGNKPTFINTSLELLKRCEIFPDKSDNLSFRTEKPRKMIDIWNGFGGTDGCFIINLIIIGRWGNMNERERKRLIYLNSQTPSNVQIRTYDQLIRKGLEGQHFAW